MYGPMTIRCLGHLLIRSCMSPIIWIIHLSLLFAYDYIFEICIKEQDLLHPMKYMYLGDTKCGKSPLTRIGTYAVTKNNPSGNFLTIYWIQAQYILLLGKQVLTIFLCIKRVRLNWNFIVNDIQSATYCSHGAPCPARYLFP